MKRPDNTLVKFAFMCKTYYRDVQLGAPREHECKGVKTLKLFRSWFRLMKNKNRLICGAVRFADGETWIWQAPDRVYNAGWKRALRADHEREQHKKPKQLTLF